MTGLGGLATALLIAATAIASEPPAESVAGRFGWLAGCWAGERGTSTFREIWIVASPDLMIGMAVTTRPSKPTEFEYVRLQTGNGRLQYVAQPAGAPPTAFDLAPEPLAGKAAVFVNMQHDFPKRVAYQRIDEERLLTWIDGGGGSRIEYPMKRADCFGTVVSSWSRP